MTTPSGSRATVLRQSQTKNPSHSMRRCWRIAWRKLQRPVVSAVTLLAYLVATIGYPMPAGSSSHPCGQRVCHCGSDEACRASGCGCRVAQASEQQPAPSCCEQDDHPPSARPSCCTVAKSQAKSQGTQSQSAAKTAPRSSVRWIVGITALKCQGHATTWIAIAAALPPPLPVTWQPTCPFLHSIPSFEQQPFIAAAKPLMEPPRFMA